MGGQEDFVNSLKAIMAAKREELGEPPTPEELLAYRDGRLDPEQRRRIEAKLAVYPDEARALADLATFPDVEAAPGTPELTDEEIGARWQTFRQQLTKLPETERPKATAAPAAVRRKLTPWWLAAAAMAALAVGWAGGFLTARASRDLPGTAINVQIAELTPIEDDGPRSAESAVAMPEGSEELVLILATEEERNFPAYTVEVVNTEGVPILTREGLHPAPLGTFHLSFRREALRPGTYRIHLFGQGTEARTRIASYELRLFEGSETR